MGILPGTHGEIRMSKTLGNHITINSDADDMFGKVMSIPDKAMKDYARLATRWNPEEVDKFLSQIEDGSVHPRNAKMQLAQEITDIFYGNQQASQARLAFINVFQKGNLPEDMPEYILEPNQTVLDVLQKSALVNSRGEGRRLLEQNGVRLDGNTLTDPNMILTVSGVLQIGKRRFLRVVKELD